MWKQPENSEAEEKKVIKWLCNLTVLNIINYANPWGEQKAPD